MIDVFGSSVGNGEIAALADVINSQWLGMGPRVRDFEARLARHLDVSDAVMTDSGSNALLLAVSILKLPPRSDIIVPSFTHVSAANAIKLAGHNPVFCDVDPETMNVRSEDVESRITPRTRAVVVVHHAGLPVEIEGLLAIGLPVIEDAAHAIAASRNGQACGTFGDIGIYSFDSVKNLTTGEGGALVASSPDALKAARKLRYSGVGQSGHQRAGHTRASDPMWWELDAPVPFVKMIPNDLAASIGLVQLSRLAALQNRRREVWDFFQSELADVAGLARPVEAPEGDVHGYFTYVIRVDQRDELARFLLSRGIYTTLRYPPLHRFPAFNRSATRLPNTDQLAERSLCLPLHSRLTDAEVEGIVSAVREFSNRPNRT